MSGVRALIVDDEPLARAGLRDLLGDVSWVEVIGEAATGPAAVEQINTLRPELVFLDIEMPGLSGTEVVRRLNHAPHVVFTTAWAQHAVTAFELGALDYLLKPFGRERLLAALERARGALGAAGHSSLERIGEALGGGPIVRLFVRDRGDILPVMVADVHRFEARGDYVAAHVGTRRHLLHVSLAQLEARLDPREFARIHRAHIVNLAHVPTFRRAGKGRLVAVLRDGTTLPVGRTRAQALRKLAE